MARLAVARGVPFAQVEALLKEAFVQAAGSAHPEVLAHRKVSRISTVTGIHRREVARLTQAETAPVSPPRSLASEVFAHWMSDRQYRRRDGKPRSLPRLGPMPSFETLAQAVTRDVHQRSLLQELLRLGLAELDAKRDTVRLLRDAFVPSGDGARMLGFLGANVGDHLNAAVDNVLGGGARHFEQAIFADGLSEASLAGVREAISAQWRAMLAALVPDLEARIAHDASDANSATRRVRIGLYTFEDAASPAPVTTSPSPGTPPARKRRSQP